MPCDSSSHVARESAFGVKLALVVVSVTTSRLGHSRESRFARRDGHRSSFDRRVTVGTCYTETISTRSATVARSNALHVSSGSLRDSAVAAMKKSTARPPRGFWPAARTAAYMRP